MKNLVLCLTLVAPFAAIAADCDMTELKNIDQRYIAVAPTCIASGDYSSKACQGVRDVILEIDQASADIKAQGCQYVEFLEDSRLGDLRTQVLKLTDAYNAKEIADRRVKATKMEKTVEFGGYVASKNNILGSVVLACYTGSLDSDGMLVSKEEQTNRYKQLVGLYEGDNVNIKRINNAFNFARKNLSDRYPLDTRGRYRADVCDQMVFKGKL